MTIRVLSGILPAMFFYRKQIVHDLNFDFFLFEHFPPLLIVDFFSNIGFNSSFVCNL